MRKVIEGERFVSKDGLHDNSVCAGDIFEIDKKIYINMRPSYCDCVLGRASNGGIISDLDMYLLRGSQLTSAKEKRLFNKQYGNCEEIDNQSIIFSLIRGRTYEFRFKDLTIKKWSQLKDSRIGRLLPPHISRMQQRYALYLQRTGLPRTPDVAVNGK